MKNSHHNLNNLFVLMMFCDRFGCLRLPFFRDWGCCHRHVVFIFDCCANTTTERISNRYTGLARERERSIYIKYGRSLVVLPLRMKKRFVVKTNKNGTKKGMQKRKRQTSFTLLCPVHDLAWSSVAKRCFCFENVRKCEMLRKNLGTQLFLGTREWMHG